VRRQACADQQFERAAALAHRGQRRSSVAVVKRLVHELLGKPTQAFDQHFLVYSIIFGFGNSGR
jgi:hypothetical protein